MQARLGLPQPIVPIFWGMLFLEATFGAYQNIWPLWIERLGAPVTVVGLVLGSSGFIRLLVLAPSATIADRFGYRRSLVVCRAATAIGLVSAAFAMHWTHLIVMLIGAAIGELAFPLVQVLVAAEAGGQRMKSFALVFTVGPSIALIVSPLIAGGLVALFGLRAAFIFGAVCTIISIYFLARIEEPAKHLMHGSDGRSTYRETLRHPGVRLISILLFATVFSLSLGSALIPNFLEDVRGLDPALIATLSAMSAVGMACFGLAVARIRRLQHAPFLAIALSVVAMMVSFALFRETTLPVLLLIAFFGRGGLLSAWAMHNAALGEIAPPVIRARAFAFCEMIGGLAFSLGPLVAGVLYSRRNTLPFELAILLCLALIPALYAGHRAAKRFRRSNHVIQIAG